MYEVIFLWGLALVYIIFAVIQDVKTKEIANWINFSMIIFALGFRFFHSLFRMDFTFLYSGLIGLGAFFIIGNLLYYGKVFAGGDAKLMIGLGAILPLSLNLSSNLQSLFNFFFLFLSVSFLYILISSAVLCFKHFKSFKREFFIQFRKNKKLMFAGVIMGIFFLVLGFFQELFFILGILTFFTSYLYLYSKAIDEACMVKSVKIQNLKEGDWLYSSLKVGKDVIKENWEGVSKSEIKELAGKYKKVTIRQGIAFSPVFLITFIAFIILHIFNIGLWNSFR